LLKTHNYVSEADLARNLTLLLRVIYLCFKVSGRHWFAVIPWWLYQKRAGAILPLHPLWYSNIFQ